MRLAEVGDMVVNGKNVTGVFIEATSTECLYLNKDQDMNSVVRPEVAVVLTKFVQCDCGNAIEPVYGSCCAECTKEYEAALQAENEADDACDDDDNDGWLGVYRGYDDDYRGIE